MRRAFPFLLGFMLALPSLALAFGPGIHCREADLAVELISELDDAWAADMEAPYGRSYLRMGSNSPDFQWATGNLNFGHSKELSYHLLKSAETLGPEHRLFALGHLSHVTGDASAEVFMTPTLFAAAPIGPMDLFLGSDGPKSESEAIVEGYGDLVNGDWDAVVETIWDLRLESPQAWQRFSDIFLWYCEAGNELYDNSDCQGAVADLNESFGLADDLLGSSDLESAKALMGLLVNQPLEALFDLYSSGLLAFLLGQESAPSDDFAFYSTLFLTGPLVDPELWTIYDQSFQNLGPIFARDHYQYEVTGWPEYDGVSIISGNIQSLLQFLPEYYAPEPGLHVTDLRWKNEAGEFLTGITAEDAGTTITAEVRLFGAQPFAGTLVGHVIRDMPGLTPDEDTFAGEGEVTVDIDPTAYSLEPQTIVSITFEADPVGADGYYIELFAGDATLPWFTSSADRLWGIEDLPMDRDPYQHFHTYENFPNSLRVTDTPEPTGALLVAARLAPGGQGIGDVEITLGDQMELTGSNGVASFPIVPPEFMNISLAREGFQGAEASVPVGPGKPSWWTVFLHALVDPIVPPLLWHENCIPLAWDGTAFQDQAADFEGRVLLNSEAMGDWVSLGTEGASELCSPDETWLHESTIQVELRPRYTDGTEGISQLSGEALMDGTPAVVKEVTVTLEDLPCESLTEEKRQGAVFTALVADGESGIQRVSVRWVEDDEWTETPLLEEAEGGKLATMQLSPGSPERTTFEIQVINGAGGIVETSGGSIPVISPCPPSEEPEVDASSSQEEEDTDILPEEESGQEEEDTSTAPPAAPSDDGGCQTQTSAGPWPWLFAWILLLQVPRTRKTTIPG